ncbi:MAG: peptide chain release factor N(5)-glutamine methyltransferase [Bdellovibrionaceae bacterium]|nr:peptide chain release factor N(5)-glutamine methyltransferase [Pseudobdellovibrionaceae bacterium]
MNLREVLIKSTEYLRSKGSPTPRLDAELLLARGLNLRRLDLYLQFDRPMNEKDLDSCRALITRRGQGEPVAYILGEKEFWGEVFEVGPGVLIPRPETEILVEEVLNSVKTQSRIDQELRIVDLGTGSGCIGLSLVKALPNARLLAIDTSAEALVIAQRNANRLEVIDRVKFIKADAAIPPECNPVDVLVANPPYISLNDDCVEADVKKFEPHSALFSGVTGLEHLRAWLTGWLPYLAPQAIVVFEIGWKQGEMAKQIFDATGKFLTTGIVRDLAGHDRVIKGIVHG